jgi:hypothetical protein
MKMQNILFVLLCVGMAGAVSCIKDNNISSPVRPDEEQEIVLAEGDKIQATTQEGALIIRAGKNDERSFEWAGAVRTAKMIRRPALWNGHLGIYNPGPSGMWRKHDGVTRVVYEEYHLSFPTKEEAGKYLSKWYAGEVTPYNSDTDKKPAGVWNDSGLVVWWKRSRWAEAMNVTVIQVFIGKGKPEKLEGSQNGNLILRHN